MTITKQEIAQFLSQNFFDAHSVSFDEDLMMSGKLDSLAVMSLVAFLEKKTGKQILAADLTIENFESIDAMSSFLERMEVR